MRPRTLGVALACLLALAAVPNAQAAARVFVSINGTDAGDCSNVTSPCRTLNFAVAAVDAGGEVIVVATGSYAGATITKSVKINVPSGVIAFSASTFTVSAGASDVVVLRGLTLKALTAGTGNGIDFTSGNSLFIENCILDSWSVGINITADNSKTFINGSTVRNSDNSGVDVLPATSALVSIDKSRFEGNGVNTAFCGVLARGGAKISVHDSVAAGNPFGYCVAFGVGEINVEQSMAVNNGAGMEIESGGTGRASNNIVTDNGTGLNNFSGTLESRGNNTVRGNGTATSGVITIIGGN